MADTMDVLIAGTGAMATLFAARLVSAGRDVTMLGSWRPGLTTLREKGARLVDVHGNENASAVRVTEDPAECRDAHYASVLVKSWQTEHTARQLEQCLAPD